MEVVQWKSSLRRFSILIWLCPKDRKKKRIKTWTKINILTL